MVQELFIELVVVIVKLLAAIIMTAGAVYTGIGVLDRLTTGIDEWKEIKKGNVAVAIFYSAVILSLLLLISERIADFIGYIQANAPLEVTLLVLVVTFINYLIGLLISIAVIYTAIIVIDHLTVGLNELSELKKGNAAIALIMAVILLGIAMMAVAPMQSIINFIGNLELSLLAGWQLI